MKELFYFVNYEKGITAIGEVNSPYIAERGYTLVDKEEYDKKSREYAKKYRLEHPEEFEKVNKHDTHKE